MTQSRELNTPAGTIAKGVELSSKDFATQLKRLRFQRKFDWVPLEPGEVTIALLDDSVADPGYSPSALVVSLDRTSRYGLNASWNLIERAKRYEANYDDLVHRLHTAYDPDKNRSTTTEDILGSPVALAALAEFNVIATIHKGGLRTMRRHSRAYNEAVEEAQIELMNSGKWDILREWDRARLSTITARRFWIKQLESIENHPEYKKVIEASQILSPEDLEFIENEFGDEYDEAEV